MRALVLLFLVACDKGAAATAVEDAAPPAPLPPASTIKVTSPLLEPTRSRLTEPRVDDTGACPSDMAQVFAYCIDRYEAPNIPGEWPLVMESAASAEAWCQKKGKRLCGEEEWEKACAGPKVQPYPYGTLHEHAACVDEREWINKDESQIVQWPEKPAMSEVTRLYQAERSGSRARCVSGYGAYDMLGNVEEWVVAKKNRGQTHVLKGCYWSGCYGGSKPTCTSLNAAHAPTFKFYETGFRCCRDARR